MINDQLSMINQYTASAHAARSEFLIDASVILSFIVKSLMVELSMEEKRHIICGVHGDRRSTFVCRHLVRGSGLGFFMPNRVVEPGEGDETCAWCGECEEVRLEQGGWNDVSEAFAGVTMICDLCFEAARARNLLTNQD
jgi:hypothetical protein